MTLAELEQTVAALIGQQETGGGTAGVGLHLNNPGALKYAPWEGTLFGATPTPSGFAQFPTVASGGDALRALVNTYVNAGASISSLIKKWAPASDGNTNNDQRINQIASVAQLDPAASIASQAGNAATAIAGAAADLIPVPDVSDFFGVDAGRLAAFVLGLVCVIAGLFMLKQTQIVVQNVRGAVNKSKALAETFAA